jgi:hypothetical protein
VLYHLFFLQNPSSSMALAMLPRALTLGGTTQWVQEMKWSDQVGGKVDFPDEMILILRVSNCQMVILASALVLSSARCCDLHDTAVLPRYCNFHAFALLLTAPEPCRQPSSCISRPCLTHALDAS